MNESDLYQPINEQHILRAPAITLLYYRAVSNDRCGSPQGGGGKPRADKSGREGDGGWKTGTFADIFIDDPISRIKRKSCIFPQAHSSVEQRRGSPFVMGFRWSCAYCLQTICYAHIP